jgi:dTDP-4-dehydrorhamnose 3,5-epimerase
MKQIDGVEITRLNIIPDNRGYLMEIFRDDDPNFKTFGQAYISACWPGAIKAWHYHEKQTDNFCCVEGNALVALHDARDDSETRGTTLWLVIGELNPVRICIPPGVWHGMAAIGGEKCIMLNIPDRHYNYDNPDEIRATPDEIGGDEFNWEEMVHNAKG